MTLVYGFLKCKIGSAPQLKSSHHQHEIQYHLHMSLSAGGSGTWDSAVNVGTNDSDDLLNYKLVYDFHHPIVDQLRAADAGFADLTGKDKLPALDFLRSDLLNETGDWRPSDVMDGSDEAEPVKSLLRLLNKARTQQLDVYMFGRKYTDGLGIHDIHMNQGSSAPFINDGEDDHNDHNDVWQDGGIVVDMGDGTVAAYFTAFTQQNVPTDHLGNPTQNGHSITEPDDGSEQ
ncbi:MAG TPA: DUF2278 family protein [Planctomycetaceae bacterium]|nr:DUF2278 family protein [Planctomycetaceae bacterium]